MSSNIPHRGPGFTVVNPRRRFRIPGWVWLLISLGLVGVGVVGLVGWRPVLPAINIPAMATPTPAPPPPTPVILMPHSWAALKAVDQKLILATAPLNQWHPSSKSLMDKALQEGISLQFGDTTPDLFSTYRRQSKTILINSRYKDADIPLGVLSSLIAGELTRFGKQPSPFAGPCLQEHIEILGARAAAYSVMPPSYKGTTPEDQYLTTLVPHWQEGQLRRLVLYEPAALRSCLDWELKG